MMKRFSTIIFAILTLMGSSASVPSTPDFCIPLKKSAATPGRQLSTAVSGGNGRPQCGR